MRAGKTALFFVGILTAVLGVSATDGNKDPAGGKKLQRIVFEEMQIEGKIRRPQLILIKAEQRPKFSSMVMQSLDSEMNVNEFARDPVLDKSPYNGAFSFDGEEITNYKP